MMNPRVLQMDTIRGLVSRYNIFVINSSYSTKRVVEIEVSPMRQVSAIMRRLGTFDLLGPQSTSTELRSSSYMSPEQSRRKPKDVSLSVQTLSIVSTAPKFGFKLLY